MWWKIIPSTDGIGAESFKGFFSEQFAPFAGRALNKAIEDALLSITQKEGFITCITKCDKPRDNIKYWRPVSLLNVVYTTGSPCPANRTKIMLPSLIDDQTCFISNRYLCENIRLLCCLTSTEAG